MQRGLAACGWLRCWHCVAGDTVGDVPCLGTARLSGLGKGPAGTLELFLQRQGAGGTVTPRVPAAAQT